MIDVVGDEMHRAAVNSDPVGKRAGVRVEAGIRRQKRGMDVDHPPCVSIDECFRQNAHETGKDDQVRRMYVDGCRERIFERIAVGIRSMVDRHRRYGAIGGDRQARRVGPVADDGHDLAGDLAVANRVEYRGHVRAAAGDQDDQPFHGPGR